MNQADRLLDDTGNQIKAVFDLWRTGLESLALIGLCHLIVPKTKRDILRVSEGCDTVCVAVVHLRDEGQNFGKPCLIVGELPIGDLEARKSRDSHDIFLRNRHDRGEGRWRRVKLYRSERGLKSLAVINYGAEKSLLSALDNP